MATRKAHALARIFCTLCTLFAAAHATPEAAFPFNSQVPTVARVDQPYTFELSGSTFTPDSGNLTYTLVNQPAWLSIDSATRTMSGTPGQGDVGSSNFLLAAADSSGAATMQCTLVVSSDPPPQLDEDLSKQLSSVANLSSSQPPMVTMLPSTTFNFDFQTTSFIDIVRRKLYFYATLTDHTPLPSWILFDPTKLLFSGTTPELSAFPQSWSINLIASDVEGFAGATSSFTIAIGTQQLVFVPEDQTVNVTAGQNFSFTTLQHQLFRNEVQLSTQDVKDAHADLPSWLHFDSSNLEITGTAPENIIEQNLTVTVIDTVGNSATAVVNLLPSNSSLFDGQVGTLVAQAGKTFEYQFNETLFSDQNLDLSVEIPSTASWLKFDSSTRTLTGTVPSSATATTVQATLTADSSSSGRGQSQIFTINVESSETTPSSSVTSTTSTRLGSRTSATNSSTSTAVDSAISEKSSSSPSAGSIAIAIVPSILGAVLLLALLLWFCRRRRCRHGYERQSPTPSKSAISRPIPSPEARGEGIIVTTELQRDVEKDAGYDSDTGRGEVPTSVAVARAEPPPRISLNLNAPSQITNRQSKLSKRFSRVSQVSSLGVGEETIRADNNIPEWGQDAATWHTPHDSFSVPTKMARVSRHLSQISPSKKALKRLRERHRSRDSVGLGISTATSGGITRHSPKGIGIHRRGGGSFGGLSTTREASSMASLSTRGTSVLSARPSEFPLPPISSASTSHSVPTLSVFEAVNKHKSIRLVQRSDSIADNRPFEDKRSSFIRNRSSMAKLNASTESPLFAHGSRASSKHRRGTESRSGNGSSGSVRPSRRSKNGKSMLTTYSESSSLEPQPHGQRTSQPRESKRLSARVKETFPANFPRVITRSRLYQENEDEDSENRSSSGWTSTSTEESWRADLLKPRHERSWVLPNEASPTPPPAAPPASRRQFTQHGTSTSEAGASRQQQWRQRLSSLSSQVQAAAGSEQPMSSVGRNTSQTRRNRQSEPHRLVSADSVSKARSRVSHSNSKRPVSVEEVQRPRSMKTELARDRTAGSEQWDDMDTGGKVEGAELLPRSMSGTSKASTHKSALSDVSGPAFL